MKLHEIRHIDCPLHEVFAFTADFSNAERWDPGVGSSRPITDWLATKTSSRVGETGDPK